MKSFKARCSLSCTSVLLTSNQGGKRKSESERKTREEIEKKEKVSAADVRSFLAEMSQQRLEGVRDLKLSFVHGSLEPGHGLIVPPGWVMSYASVGEEQHVAGVRTSFLLRFGLEKVKDQFEHMLARELADKQWLNFLLTLVRVELKGRPAKQGADGEPANQAPSKKLKLKV